VLRMRVAQDEDVQPISRPDVCSKPEKFAFFFRCQIPFLIIAAFRGSEPLFAVYSMSARTTEASRLCSDVL
jgi:hypothetical protein